MTRAARGWLAGLLLAFVGGFAIGAGWLVPDAPADPAVAILRDSLAQAEATIDTLEAGRQRARIRAWEDSLALAESRRRLRLVASSQLPARVDTVGGDTVQVFEIPLPVLRHVETLERRVGSLEVALDTTTLALLAERNARALERQLREQAERALATEQKRRWRYRLEGAVIVGPLLALAAAALIL